MADLVFRIEQASVKLIEFIPGFLVDTLIRMS